jgi:hypothetical protein
MNSEHGRQFADLSRDAAFFELLTGSYASLVGTPLVAEGQGPLLLPWSA